MSWLVQDSGIVAGIVILSIEGISIRQVKAGYFQHYNNMFSIACSQSAFKLGTGGSDQWRDRHFIKAD